MRVMLMIKGDPEPGATPSEELLTEMGRYNQELQQAGVLLDLAGLLTGLVNALITSPFGQTAWFLQAVVAAVATVITLPYSALVGVLLYLDLRARKESLTLEALRADLQASAT